MQRKMPPPVKAVREDGVRPRQTHRLVRGQHGLLQLDFPEQQIKHVQTAAEVNDMAAAVLATPQHGAPRPMFGVPPHLLRQFDRVVALDAEW